MPSWPTPSPPSGTVLEIACRPGRSCPQHRILAGQVYYPANMDLAPCTSHPPSLIGTGCRHACAHAHTHTHAHTRTHTHTHAHTRTHTHTRMRTGTHAGRHACGQARMRAGTQGVQGQGLSPFAIYDTDQMHSRVADS